jgi:hypothetical protein
MPPKQTSCRSAKATQHKARAETAISATHHGGAAYQFSAPRDDEYVHSGSSLSDAESAEEAKDDTSPGIIIYISVIFCITLIKYSS